MEYLEKRGDIEELKEKYNKMDEDFAEMWLDEFDDMSCQSAWNSLSMDTQDKMMKAWAEDFPDFYAKLTDDGEEESYKPP